MRAHGRQSPNTLLLLRKSCEIAEIQPISPGFPYLFPLDPSLLPKRPDGISPDTIESHNAVFHDLNFVCDEPISIRLQC